MNGIKLYTSVIILLLTFNVRAQLSPGDLSQPHAHLEGMSNCTKCHTLGSRISNDKCLSCHTEIKTRVDKKQGYHASEKVYKKSCILCHSEHHGRKYEIVRFKEQGFDHNATGYKLEGKHAEKQCRDCHKPAFITDPLVKKKNFTFLGLNRDCRAACHDDCHQGTLSPNCLECHTFNAFKPAPKFNHSKAAFALKGKHQQVECNKCHTLTTANGKEFRKYKGIPFAGCASCHKDVHDNKFGQRCADCHTEESFRAIKNTSGFNHNLTNFKLEGKHENVACRSCHKGNLTDALKHDQCSDCHTDYHKGEFKDKSPAPDCKACHTVEGFDITLFTVEQHQQADFKLEGAHRAVPCFACHQKPERWKFRQIGETCNDCHKDIHEGNLDPKYYPEKNCRECHSAESWRQITFNHNKTKFPLTGKHEAQSCRSCHLAKAQTQTNNKLQEAASDKEAKSKDAAISKDAVNSKDASTPGKEIMLFTGLKSECQSCHTDEHEGQFAENNITNCASCHVPDGWPQTTFDHNNARFQLDGRHKAVACNKCHPLVEQGQRTYVLYKTGKIRCADCH